MKIAVLTANLGKFDINVPNADQILPKGVQMDFHRFTDENFPPITGLTPRFQYRIPKLFGWQMFPGYDYYIWMDGSFSMQHGEAVKWFLDRCQGYDMAVFRHPWRKTLAEEVAHIDKKLAEGNKYITQRYTNGLHKEQLASIIESTKYTTFKDENLYASTSFIYKNNLSVISALNEWWLLQSRYYTCDQIAMTYALRNLNLNVIEQNQYKIPYLTLTSKHK